jgi:DNA-binding transcriptional ArsR family regulator
VVGINQKFTRIPKVADLLLSGIPTEVIPTYCALADYSNNKTGLCWPRMQTMAKRLSRSPRTVQRHLHLLKEKGLIEFVERKRDAHGRFGAYVYRVLHIAAVAARKGTQVTKSRKERRAKPATTGHGQPLASIKRQTKQNQVSPLPHKIDRTAGFKWLFGQDVPPAVQDEHDRHVADRRKLEAQRRKDGYEWFFR